MDDELATPRSLIGIHMWTREATVRTNVHPVSGEAMARPMKICLRKLRKLRE
jgi:hypothetical protein